MNTAAYLQQDQHLFYKLETGKVTAVDINRKWIKQSVCVPSIYANKLKIITKEEFENAIKLTGL